MYLGAAMSVTAFPVLARIIQERGIAGTALGTLALAAGATAVRPPTRKPWGQSVSYVRDPDGVLVELCTSMA